MKPRLKAAHLAQIERQEVEEQRPLGLGRDRQEIAFGGLWHLAMNILEIRRLAAHARPVVDDFAMNLACGDVDECHEIKPS